MPRLLRRYRARGARGRCADRMLERVPELVEEYSTGAGRDRCPSFFEGFGFPASEAMACGLPVDRQHRRSASGGRRHGWASTGRSSYPQRNPRALAAMRSAKILEEPGRAAQHGPGNARAPHRAQSSAGSEAASGLDRSLRGDPTCCSPSISIGLSVPPGGPGARRRLRRRAALLRRTRTRRASRGARPGPRLRCSSCSRRRFAQRALASSNRLGAMIQRRHLCTCPFADESFDKVICSEVMEHVHDYRACRTRARASDPAATAMVAVTIPTATSEHLYLRSRRRLLRIARCGHIRIFRPQRTGAGPGGRRARHCRRRLRPCAAHALLGAAQRWPG